MTHLFEEKHNKIYLIFKLMSEELGDVEQWFVHYTPKVIDEVNIYPNVSVFNRQIYTFETDKKYLSNLTINYDIESYDNLQCLKPMRVYTRKVPLALLFVCIGEQKFAALGELGQPCIEKDRYNDINMEVKRRKDWQMVPISYLHDKSTISQDL